MQKIKKRYLLNLTQIFYFLLFLITIIFISSNTILSGENPNLDTDSDGLKDIYENLLGSNLNDSSDVSNIIISGSDYLLVDTDDDNISDIFFDSSLTRYNTIENQNGILYIDSNFDNTWDYTYDNNILTPIEDDSSEMPWIFIIAGIIVSIVIVIVLILFKTGILYIYEEEYIVEE